MEKEMVRLRQDWSLRRKTSQIQPTCPMHTFFGEFLRGLMEPFNSVMPAWQGILSEEHIWQIILLRTL
jgi:hypothetical protein